VAEAAEVQLEAEGERVEQIRQRAVAPRLRSGQVRSEWLEEQSVVQEGEMSAGRLAKEAEEEGEEKEEPAQVGALVAEVFENPNRLPEADSLGLAQEFP